MRGELDLLQGDDVTQLNLLKAKNEKLENDNQLLEMKLNTALEILVEHSQVCLGTVGNKANLNN